MDDEVQQIVCLKLPNIKSFCGVALAFISPSGENYLIIDSMSRDKKIYRVLQIGMSPNYGGTEAFVYGIYDYMDKNEIQFDFLNVYDAPLAREEWLRGKGAHIYSLKLKRREGLLKYRRGIINFYKRHSGTFNCVVCNVQSLEQLDMAKYAKRNSIKTVVHCHNCGFGVKPSLLTRLAFAWNKMFSHRYIDMYFACSELAAKWALGKKVARCVHYIKNGIEPSTFAYNPQKRNQFRSQYGLKEEDYVIGTAGRMDLQKNQLFFVDTCFELLKLRPETRFVLVGEGALNEEIRQRVANYQLESSFIFIPRLSNMPLFYSGIDCFLLPSLFEGLGIVLLEAQCAGLPCFATKGTIPPEVAILPSFTFLCLELGPFGWASAVSQLTKCENRFDASNMVLAAGWTLFESARIYKNLLFGKDVNLRD